jgi:hypothetical protein
MTFAVLSPVVSLLEARPEDWLTVEREVWLPIIACSSCGLEWTADDHQSGKHRCESWVS